MKKCVVFGASGTLGSHLLSPLAQKFNVYAVTAKPVLMQKVVRQIWCKVVGWDYSHYHQLMKILEDAYAVINLSWAPMLPKKRTKTRKNIIRSSRVDVTQAIENSLPNTGALFLNASAVWYYPPSDQREYDEYFVNDSPSSFLENLCIAWENAAMQAQNNDRKVYCLRSSVVLTAKIEQFMQMTWRLPFFMFLAWQNTWVPTISIVEWVSRVVELINNNNISSWPINLVTKNQKFSDLISTKIIQVPRFISKIFVWNAHELFMDHRVSSTYFS